MREFTADTAKAFGKSGLDAMQKCQQQLKEDYKDKYDEKAFFFRKIIADGDDMTFVCNARFVMDYVRAYLEAVQNYNNKVCFLKLIQNTYRSQTMHLITDGRSSTCYYVMILIILIL